MGKDKRSAEMPTSPKRPPIDFKVQQQAQHAATISLIVKNTGKIQKEIGFRRSRLKVSEVMFNISCVVFLCVSIYVIYTDVM
jgi:hypothetical protein